MNEQKIYSPLDVARRLGVGRGKVVSWITRGELLAVNVATATGAGKRARYRIQEKDLLAFEVARSTSPHAVAMSAAGPTGAKAGRLRRQVTEFIE